MKCPKCQHEQKKKDGLKCSKCNYQFVLSPNSKISDYDFFYLLKRINKESTIYFTNNNVYSEYIETILTKKKQRSKTYGILSVISLIICFTPIFFIGIIPFLIFMGKWIQYKVFAKEISFNEMMSYLLKWSKNKEQYDFLIDEKKLVLNKAPQKKPENDIFNYGLEGVVFVDNDYYVDWFVLNNFHFTYRVAVLSMNTYPKYLLAEIKQLVEENSLLPIYFLHDGTITKTEMIEKLNTHILLDKQKYLIDIGLFYNDFMVYSSLKEKVKTIPFSTKFPLDSLHYSEICALFSHAKSKIDGLSKTEEIDEDGEVITIDDGLMIDVGLQSLDVTKRDMDLDFG